MNLEHTFDDQVNIWNTACFIGQFNLLSLWSLLVELPQNWIKTNPLNESFWVSELIFVAKKSNTQKLCWTRTKKVSFHFVYKILLKHTKSILINNKQWLVRYNWNDRYW